MSLMVSRDSSHQRNIRISATVDKALPHKVICSIYMSKSISPVIGISFAMIDTAVIISTEINDSLTLTKTMNKIEIYNPTEIIVDLGCSKKLISILESNVYCNISLINKRYFKADLEMLSKVAIDSDTMSELKERNFANCAATALMTYSRELFPNFNRFRFKYEPCEATMFIDMRTAKSLELVENITDKNQGLSLFKFLNSTCTKMGKRVLRNNILQPLSDLDSLKLRVESVQQLLQNHNLLKEIRENLKMYQDLDRIFNIIVSGTTNNTTDQNINNVILIKQTICTTEKINSLLQDSDATLLKEIKQLFDHENVRETRLAIDEYINEDCKWASSPLDLKNQKCYAVKSGSNGLLDVSRQLYQNIINEIMDLIDSLAEEFKLQLDSNFDSSRGFTIRIKNLEIIDLPDVFINKTIRRGKFVECSTLDLMKLNARLHNALNEILLMSDNIIEELLDKIRTKISVFFMLSEAVAILDLLSCFAHNVINNSSYTCPELNMGSKIVVKESRHPIFGQTDFVLNDIISIYDTSRVQIITGPNLSGKSVYLRQVLLLVIMAQIGSFVPAEYAMLPMFLSLHARISSDNYEINASTFSSEMTEMSNILKEVNDKSLVIIDELGRGSSLEDGFAISLAITESLSSYLCTAFVSTHFNDIPKILNSKQGFIHLQMKAEVLSEEIIQFHKLEKCDENNKQNLTEGYGLLMAEIFLPKLILDDAKIVSKMLSDKKIGKGTKEKDEQIFLKRRLMLNLVENLKILREREQDTVTNLKLLQDVFIKNFQDLITP